MPIIEKNDLKEAIKRGDDEIIIQGKLINDVKILKKFGKLGLLVVFYVE